MKSTKTTEDARCPACMKTLSGATSPFGDYRPSAGDLSVCVYCTVLLTFNSDLTLRLLRSTEFEALEPDQQAELTLARAIAARALPR